MITGENWVALITVPQYEGLQREELPLFTRMHTHTLRNWAGRHAFVLYIYFYNIYI